MVVRWLNLKGVGWIRPDGTRETVFVHFSEISQIHTVQLGQSSLRVGERVEFEVVEDYGGKVKAIDVTPMDGNDFQPGYTRGEKILWKEGTDAIREVCVLNLAWGTQVPALKKHFSQAGNVAWAGIRTDGWDEVRKQPYSKGWGTVRYRDPKDARRAINELNGTHLDGRELYVVEYLGQKGKGDEMDGAILPWT